MSRQAIREDSLVMSTRQAAATLGISDYLAQRLVRDGTIPSIKLGHAIRIPKKAIERMLEGEKPNS